MNLFDPAGHRLYLALPMRGVDLAGKVIVLETLKKRRGVYRACRCAPSSSTWCMASE